ncbi:zinc finger C2HC domain-containing protein 1C isoform X2 [Eleutherodactylus coqui]|uniref:C2HC/C3H-type domain-containing protein n=1 Tax=Eleutherodactylus coqui TaxID=57060 RepID=A0A8J6K7P9_ELECQ|nr:hypothetical protein GDO78_010756 [Eleutherodactylus coqui]
MASYTEGLSESQLLPLQRGKRGPRVLSKLEMLKNDYQDRALLKKEQKMLQLLTQQQGRISQRINGYRTLHPPEEKAWASNWTVAKRTEGVDRAHPLKPVYPRSEATVHRSPSANTEGIKRSPPYPRSKSGPSRTDQWQELEKREMSLEAEIHRKEVLLREKLRRTEEELRRIQKEKEEAEQEERKAREIHDTRTRPRRLKLEEGDHRGNVKTGKDCPLSIEPYSKGRVKATLLSIDRCNEGNVKTGKESPLSIDKYSKGRVKAALLSIDHGDEGSVKTGKDCPLSIDPYSGGKLKARKYSPLFMDKAHQQYGGTRDTVHPVLQCSPLTCVVDSFKQMRLETPGVQNSEPPSSEDFDNGNLSHSEGQQLAPCQLCGRRFMEQRLQKHQAVCEKMHSSKRKVFDSSKARAKGTDLEQYLNKKGNQLPPASQERTNSWPQKHEASLRTNVQARVVKDHIAREGRISNRPPRPPKENPGYVTCPECSRRFAPGAAERHIPKCKTIKSKPRPPPAHRH